MPTWHICAPPILFWHWHPFNLFPSSCITWIFFVDSHWWVPLCVEYLTIYMPFRQIIMYILQCPHDIHILVHLFCFDLHKFLLRTKTIISHFTFYAIFNIKKKYWKVPLHLLVKWEVVTPNSREGQFESISIYILYSLVLILYLKCGGGLVFCMLEILKSARSLTATG